MENLLLELDRLDDEAQRRAHAVDILAHDLFHYGSLSGIVESSAWSSACDTPRVAASLH